MHPAGLLISMRCHTLPQQLQLRVDTALAAPAAENVSADIRNPMPPSIRRPTVWTAVLLFLTCTRADPLTTTSKFSQSGAGRSVKMKIAAKRVE